MSEDDSIVPEVIDHNNLRVSNLTIPLRMIGTVTTAEELVKEWNRLATKDFPLRDLAAFCYTADAGFFRLSDDISPEATKYRPPPLLSHLVNIIDLILRIQNIEGAALRINNLKQELSTLVSSAYEEGANHDKIEGNIIKTILSAYDEYLIGSYLFNIYPTIKFNPAAGSDYILDDMCISIESKSKLNRKYIGYGLDLNDLDKNQINLDEKTCLKLLSKDVFEAGRIEEAFDKQDTDIAILNTTHSQFGPLFAAYARITNGPVFRFNRNIIHAVDNAREKKKMIILCSESLSYNEPFELFAVAEEKETIENYGSRLDKIENDKKINTKTDEGFRSLVEEARKMN